MVSELFLDDIATLEAQGITLAPSEIIRLNELGLRVERGPSAIASAPRIGWAGDIPIYEPTIQVEEWRESYLIPWFGDSGDNYYLGLVWACAHGRQRGFFSRSEAQDRDTVIAEIQAWYRGLSATNEELCSALRYAIYGCEAGSDIVPEPSDTQVQTDSTSADYRTDVIDSLIATGLGLSIEEMGTLTESRLIGILRKWVRSQGTADTKNIREHADYIRTLTAIRKQHEADKCKAE